VIAVSPLIAGKTVKGPAARMMEGLGLEALRWALRATIRALPIAMVIDTQDERSSRRHQGAGHGGLDHRHPDAEP
jgi:LPPG:FO 2-phospho-L-lactate transferase